MLIRVIFMYHLFVREEETEVGPKQASSSEFINSSDSERVRFMNAEIHYRVQNSSSLVTVLR